MTNRSRYSTAEILSLIIAFLAAFVSAGGLFFKGLYRDNAFVTTTWIGNDAVTLLLAVPILLISIFSARRGSLKARLIWLGILDYMLYNYAFYLFGAAFNAFFLFYASLLGLSIFALIYAVTDIDPNEIHSHFREKTPVKWIGGYFIFVACGLSIVYLIQSIGFIMTGKLPSIVTISGHPTSVVFALDFTLLIPWLVLGAIWLIKHRPWGTVIAAILSVKGPLYTFVLSVNSLLVMRAGLTTSSEIPLWGSLTLLGGIFSALLFGNMNTKDPTTPVN